jgi:hypothetical protein
MEEENEFETMMQARLAQLPRVVQDAIESADVSGHLRELANTHKLHLDQWETLENEVRMAILGVKNSGDIEQNLVHEVGVSSEVAHDLADDISSLIFEPIRQELERLLDHPDAQAKTETGVEAMTAQTLSSAHSESEATLTQPGPLTPTPSAPETKAARAPISDAYKVGETSLERKDVHSDPYRETPA